jgi:hypothetical protein
MTRSTLLAAVLCIAPGCLTEDPATSAVESLAALESHAQSHAVDPSKELAITDPSVIAAPIETVFDPAHPSGMTRFGAWSFGRLVHNMLPAGQRDSALAASQLVLSWLATWETDQAPNPGVSAARARPGVRLQLTNPWKAASGCAEPENPATDATCVLDMQQAPFKLMAIFARPDLRIVAGNDQSIGGEGRFVFQVVAPTLGVSATTGHIEVMDPTPKPQRFTVIFEYSLPVLTDVQTVLWAEKWHLLGTKQFGNPFNAYLLTLTNAFSGPDADSRRPNGNALNQLRTNEVSLVGARVPADGFVAARQIWELREFHLTTAGLVPHTMNLEPSRDFDIAKPLQVAPEGTRSAELVTFLNDTAVAVGASTHALPPGMAGNSTLVGSAPYGAWGKLTNSAPGAEHGLTGVSIPVRDSFALNTCAGCHRHETDTRHFMHVSFVGALEPAERERLGVQTAPDYAVVLSDFLRAELAGTGARTGDFTQLLVTNPNELVNKVGLRACR